MSDGGLDASQYLPRNDYAGEPAAVTAVREEAIQRADRPPSYLWKEHAHAVIRATALRRPFLTSEDVWDTGLQRPDFGSPDGDALGPAMRRARRAGFIEPTDRTEARTDRPQRHNNPKRVWRSLIYQGAAGAGVREPVTDQPPALSASAAQEVPTDMTDIRGAPIMAPLPGPQ